ncbi:MAG: hypothetical protein GF409_08615 [Candidatus Omnitrophica bacterium]|nr:hypothetical protein [Candidatus Omnitrophota bacterium]
MKIARFIHEGKEKRGTIEGDWVHADGIGAPLTEVTLLSPVFPTKIVSVGLNYTDHALELGMEVPDEPVIFLKPSTSVIGPDEAIIYPEMSKRVDYEAELGVVIKKTARHITKEEVPEYIEGYTCFNDVTARDLQKKDGQWTRAKSFDTFAPVGPFIETELDPADVGIRSFLNGELRQNSRTSNLIFNVQELVSFISSVMTLQKGDIIATGTPANIGPMRPGDEVVVEIDGVGRLVNSVESEKKQ